MFKSWLKRIFIIALELAVITGALWYLRQKGNLDKVAPMFHELISQTEEKTIEKPFPELAGQIERNFEWEYKGKKYSLSETLHQSSYDYYRSQPKVFSYNGNLPANWEEEYYGMFLRSNKDDRIISQLTIDLQNLGRKNKLSDDQIVEFVMAFVQAIPYDDAKAKNILAKTDNETMRYPYEVLFEKLGVCSDKSLLATAILRQLGYGVALFAYEQDNHMAIGIQCPKNSSTYGDGYCYAETTSVGNKIGVVPGFDSQSNKTVEIGQLATLGVDDAQQVKLSQLGQVTIYQKTFGKEYFGAQQTQKIIIEIDSLKKTIDSTFSLLQSQKINISREENELESMKKDLEKFQKAQNAEKFNKLVEKYNDLIEIYQKDAKKYNKDVALYNQAIARYNTLIKQ